MAKANALNTDLSNCTGLPLSTGVSGDIAIANIASGNNASSSTFYAANEWILAPNVDPGPQYSLAYYASIPTTTLSPLTSVPNSIMLRSATPTWGVMLDGQIPIATSSDGWSVGNITGSNGVYVVNGANSIEIGYSPAFNDVTGTSETMSDINVYLANNASLVTLTLPASSSLGDFIKIVGTNTGGWKIAQNAGQTIRIGSTSSTVGVGGSVSSANPTDSIELICLLQNAEWGTVGGPGSSGLIVV